MQQIDDRLVLSATDLTKHLACPHVTMLDLAVAQGRLERPEQGIDEQLQLIFDMGLDHEVRYLEAWRASGARVVEIGTDHDRHRAERDTIAAMRRGVDVIYQATLYDGRWLGYADFLLRHDLGPGEDVAESRFGSYAYDIADTKLARRLKVPALLQLATYAERLEQLQGVPPPRLLVVTGDRREHAWRLLDVSAYARRARSRLRAATQRPTETEPVPNRYCAQCRWLPACTAQWQQSDDLSLVAGMRGAHRDLLRAGGIATVEQLAAAGPGSLGMLSPTVRDRLHRQARLHVQERSTGRPVYELLPPVPGRGLLRLPEPDAGDLYLDFEGDPFADDGQGREYLAGLWDRGQRFRCWWAHDRDAEATLVSDLLEALVQHWREHPGMHVYHYAPYETTALKRLTGRYGVGEADLDALLRGERFVDLFAVVRHGVAIGKPSYSIKKMEDLYWGRIRPTGSGGSAVADGLSSVVAYERYLTSGDASILDRIRDYNRDDVRSTHALHDWLEQRRTELLGTWPQVVAGSGRIGFGEVSLEEAADSEGIRVEKELAQALVAAGHDLLAGLVGWHRREDRPEYWEFFSRADMSDDELVDSSATLGRLGSPSEVGVVASAKTGRVTSRVYRYDCPPQDCALGVGDLVVDVGAGTGAGTITAIDVVAGWVEVKRGVRKEPVPARAFGPSKPINNQPLRAALMRAGHNVLSGQPGLPGAVVAGAVPADLALLPGQSPAEAVVRVGLTLDGTVLAVQGPPGAGKTYAGSALIRTLLDAGYRVGVTANSHAVIRNLLCEVGRPALHKVSAEQPPVVNPAPAAASAAAPVGITETTSNTAVDAALADGSVSLVGGTAWLWARPELAGAVDVLVIDEAGQCPLANAVAAAGAARSVVLLGDPQQLSQPTRADHPYGAEVSALQHFIGDHQVIPADRGIFLDRTWRMHPQITRFVSDLSYEGRLTSAAGRARQGIQAPGLLTGSGLRWVPIPHTGNVADSRAEALVVAALVADLVRGHWRDADGCEHPMTPADVLVVSPYNAHVRTLRAVLPDRVRVGTVDRFQGQQAPAVIYSMASSSAADAPRGVGFLFDVHRLTVGVSRARALSVIVASPALLDTSVADPGQLRAVNALCEYVERAQLVDPDGLGRLF
ncbi:MAG TPA: TM0106 family RecB-like putative nuclease [Dermatophilaceae bacterium]|nr:TM0106 family RecB-like putative nuclease [Dermatophilaceae bacterium]